MTGQASYRHSSLPFLLTLLLAITVNIPVPALGADGKTIRSYLEITPGNLSELEDLLASFESAGLLTDPDNTSDPVVIILHGDEAIPFTRSNYAANRALIDRTALLDAYRLIDVRMCETWMRANGISKDELLPFIDPVPYAPDEVRKLTAEGYRPYGSVKL